LRNITDCPSYSQKLIIFVIHYYHIMDDQSHALKSLVTKRYFEIFDDIRSQLHAAGLKELSLSFPIVQEDLKNCMGFCYALFEDWKVIHPNVKMAKKAKVERLALRITHEITGEIYDIQSLIGTLLHELSHCITPLYLKRQDERYMRSIGDL
jgi:hypothetical protein